MKLLFLEATEEDKYKAVHFICKKRRTVFDNKV